MKVRKRLFVIASVALLALLAFLALLLNGPGCASLASLSDYRHGKMHYSGTALDLAFIGDGPWVMLLWAWPFVSYAS